MPGGVGFRGGVAFNPVVKRPGQGASGASEGVLAVGETGVTWWFGVRVLRGGGAGLGF